MCVVDKEESRQKFLLISNKKTLTQTPDDNPTGSGDSDTFLSGVCVRVFSFDISKIFCLLSSFLLHTHIFRQ